MPALELEGRLPAHKQIHPELANAGYNDAEAVTGVRKVQEATGSYPLQHFNDAGDREERIPRQPGLPGYRRGNEPYA
jgi:hypothetical protein